MENNKNNILVGISVLLVVFLIIAAGYIGYLKKEITKNDKPLRVTENDYKIYANKLKEEEKKYTNDFYNQIIVESYCVEKSYKVNLDNNSQLSIEYYDNELNTKYQKIADNILSFFVIETGNGGCNTLYFINTDGTVGQANVETFLANNDGTGEITINKNIKNLKNIVYITSAINNATASATSNPIFIDINGNMYK